MERKLSSFGVFWPYYVSQHVHPVNRALHFLGTSMALAAVSAALTLGAPLALLLAPLVGYGPAWSGHYFFEKKPARHVHPPLVVAPWGLAHVSPDVDGADGARAGPGPIALSSRSLTVEPSAPGALHTERFMKAALDGQPVLNSQDSRMAGGASSRGHSANPIRAKYSRASVVRRKTELRASRAARSRAALTSDAPRPCRR